MANHSQVVSQKSSRRYSYKRPPAGGASGDHKHDGRGSKRGGDNLDTSTGVKTEVKKASKSAGAHQDGCGFASDYCGQVGCCRRPGAAVRVPSGPVRVPPGFRQWLLWTGVPSGCRPGVVRVPSGCRPGAAARGKGEERKGGEGFGGTYGDVRVPSGCRPGAVRVPPSG